jgi:hypothetical protein
MFDIKQIAPCNIVVRDEDEFYKIVNLVSNYGFNWGIDETLVYFDRIKYIYVGNDSTLGWSSTNIFDYAYTYTYISSIVRNDKIAKILQKD